MSLLDSPITTNAKHSESGSYAQIRHQMVDSQLAARGITDPNVLEVMRSTPREAFVPKDQVAVAYEDRALPVGHGQTISQPYIVACMTEALHLKRTDVVLEIGTGTGYQTAILASLARHVFTIESLRPLSEAAQERLGALGHTNIHFRIGDGSYGWPEFSPYDAIIVTAAAPAVIQTLVDQLHDGGRMIVPVGDDATQTLTLIERKGRCVVEKPGIQVRFVKLLGEFGFAD